MSSPSEEVPRELPLHLPGWLICVHCGVLMLVQELPVRDHFYQVKGLCPNCSQSFDWWEAVFKSIREVHLFGPFAAIGAKCSLLTIKLEPAKEFNLDLNVYGIPSNARILQITYTPNNGNLFPIEVHSNTPRRHTIPAVLKLYPRPLRNEPGRTTDVAIGVSWVPNTEASEAWQNLVDGFEAFADGRFPSAVIPANVAVETTMNQLLSAFLEKRGISGDRVERFLVDGATYKHQLNVVLPALLGFTSAPALPDNIRGGLNRLADLRNEMAHKGVFKAPVSHDEMAKCLCAALFGFHYLELVKIHLT